MAADFLHGVETLEVVTQGQLIQQVRSSVIFLNGISPIGPKNVPTVVLSPTDDTIFGKPLTGFNIPKTLEIIRKIAGGCIVVVNNVFDSTANTVQVTQEAQTVTNGVLKLTNEPVGAVTVFNSDNSAATIVAGTDYKIDEYGNFKALSSLVANGTVFKFSYKKLSISTVTASQLIGTVDGTTQARTGFKTADLCYNLFGYNPKIIISPLFTTLSGVSAEMISVAQKFEGTALLDTPLGTSRSVAIAGRGPSGTFGFNTNAEEADLLFPWVVSYDTATNSNQPFPQSAFKAGVMVKNDLDNGYWFSPSNKPINIAIKGEVDLTFNPSDPNTDVNLLNAAGINTIANTFGTGILTWGNRNASFPTSNDPKNFISVKRTAQQISDTLKQAALRYIDQPLVAALISVIKEDGNNYVNSLIQRGALLVGSEVQYFPEDNSPAELSNGHIVFRLKYLPPAPAERITYKTILDITLYQSLK